MELKSYPLSVITTRMPQARSASNDLEVENSIAADGIKMPVLVRPFADRLWQVIDGERRIAFARKLHERGKLKPAFIRIPCLAITVASDQEEALWRFVFNLHTGLPPDETDRLAEMAGIATRPGVGARCVVGGPSATDPIVMMSNLLQALAERRHQLRSSRKAIDALEAGRAYLAGHCTLQGAMDLLRLSSEDK